MFLRNIKGGCKQWRTFGWRIWIQAEVKSNILDPTKRETGIHNINDTYYDIVYFCLLDLPCPTEEFIMYTQKIEFLVMNVFAWFVEEISSASKNILLHISRFYYSEKILISE